MQLFPLGIPTDRLPFSQPAQTRLALGSNPVKGLSIRPLGGPSNKVELRPFMGGASTLGAFSIPRETTEPVSAQYLG